MKKFELFTICTNCLGGWVDLCNIQTDTWDGSLLYIEWGSGGWKFDVLWMAEAVRNTVELFKFGR